MRVAANALAHRFNVGAQLFGQVGHLVHEADLGRQHGVGSVFGELCAAHVHHQELVAVAVERGVELAQLALGTGTVGAYHNPVGPLAVGHGRAFLEEFGVGDDVELQFQPPRRQTFAHGGGHTVGGAHGHGGFVDDAQRFVHVLRHGARDRQHVAQVGAAILARRRAHSQEQHFGMAHALGGIGGKAQATQGGVVRHKGLKPGFIDGNAPGAQSLHLGFVHVHAQHLVAHIGQYGPLHKAHIACAKYGDFHAA